MMPTRHDLRESLTRAGEQGLALLDRLSDGDLARETTNERWCVREHLVHLVNSEPGLCRTIRAALKDEWVIPEDFDLDRWNQRQVERNNDLLLSDLRREFAVNRAATLALLEELTDVDFDRQARHASLKVLSLGEFFQIIENHQYEHLGAVEAALA